MEILERKEPKKNWSLDIVCESQPDQVIANKYHCGSRLRIVATDVKNMIRTATRGTAKTIYCVICPVCDEVIELEKTKVPNFVKLQAERITETRVKR